MSFDDPSNAAESVPELMATIGPFLEPGETVLWKAMAVPRHFTPVGRGVFTAGVALAIFVGSFGWSQIFSRWHGGVPDGFWVFLIFSAIALGMLNAPRMEFRRLSNRGYVITDKRAFVVRLDRGERGIEVYPKEEWGPFEVRPASGDTGDVRFSWSFGIKHRKIGGEPDVYEGREGQVRIAEWLEGVSEPYKVLALLHKVKGGG